MRKAEFAREAGVLRSGADVETLRRIQVVTMDELNAKAGQRLATPAAGRAGAMRTAVERHPEAGTPDRSLEHLAHLRMSALAARDRRLPRQRAQRPALILVGAQGRRLRLDAVHIVAPQNDRPIHVRIT